jgi:hypothetical protein
MKFISNENVCGLSYFKCSLMKFSKMKEGISLHFEAEGYSKYGAYQVKGLRNFALNG